MASRTVVVGSTGGLHARPAALFVAAAQAQPIPVTIRVAGKPAVPAGSMLSVLALRATFGTEVVLEADGDGADAALDALAALVAQNLDEEEKPQELQGIGVSPGFAAGPAYRLVPPPSLPAPVAPGEGESARALQALRDVSTELAGRASGASDQTAAQILRAQVMMIDDPVLGDSVAAAVLSGMDAPHAIDNAFASHRRTFEAAGGYLAERVTDLDDLRDRAVAAALGVEMPGIPDPGTPFVLIARDLAPADTAGLDPGKVLAVVTERGGPTSHMAIVARSLGVVAVVRCPNAMAISDGTTVSVDGSSGKVAVGVDQATVDATRKREQVRVAALAASSGAGRTSDGHAVALLANIGSARDLDPSSEGVGLFRTELLYLDRADAPSLEEQIAVYTNVFELNEGRRMVVRTLDSGADKALPFLHHDEEPNPALGIRGLRLARRHPDVLETQLAAISAAARATGADIWVMAPMVATTAEAAGFTARCRAAGLNRAGVMVEIPAAALRAGEILAVCDFISIGTNDLSQYTFAADRENGDLAELNDPWQPALLRLIAMCGEAGLATGKPVGVCGEAAADPALAPILVGLGVGSLSMPARAIAACRESLAQHSLAQCQSLAQKALAAGDTAAARALAGSA
jgi:phosphotransferase system enzyme I (PtsI)